MITLIGHGYVGTYLHNFFIKNEIDHEWISHTENISEKSNFIVNAAGYTGSPNVDSCEVHKQECIEGNVIFPLELERKSKVPIIHITSGCVYTGYKDGGWLENDPPNFDFNNGSFYSGTKNLSQGLLNPYLNRSYLLRIRMPFTEYDDPKNFLTKLKTYSKLIDFRNSLTYVKDLAEFVKYILQNSPEPGIYNVCNPGSVTTKEVADLMGLKKEWFTEEEFKDSVTAPRSNCVLNTSKIENLFPIRSVKDALSDALS